MQTLLLSSTPLRVSAPLRPTLAWARVGAALALLSLATVCAAQPAPPVQAGLPPPEPAVAAAPAPMPLQLTPVAQGLVRRFTINPEGDVDGFLLDDGTLVSFPPHMGTQLVEFVQPGDRVVVDGLRDSSGDIKAQQIRNARTGQQLVDQPPGPPDAGRLPPALRGAGLVRLTARGTILQVTTAPRGEPDGVLLRDGTVIKLTPPAAQQFIDLLKPGIEVAAAGYGTRNQYGEALQATLFGVPGRMVSLYDSAPR
ncbi:hypothetical protein [Paraburkholderia nodosa]|uniref:hypothetical protein n=1 Tax=Paraburkholderia nodosa TaxID=392320 RepID=UPI00054D01B4|nr:hypothetical protein [Paraburkholderia nodosa]